MKVKLKICNCDGSDYPHTHIPKDPLEKIVKDAIQKGSGYCAAAEVDIAAIARAIRKEKYLCLREMKLCKSCKYRKLL